MSRSKPAPTQHPVLEAVRLRWSPRAWTAEPVPAATLATLFEAARWAPSSFNEQPWRWLVAGREDPDAFALMLSCLVESNQRWARRAGALALAVTREHFTHNEKPNHHAWHDLGQACALMAVQAAGMGLQIHQMGGVEPERARQVYGVPAGFQVVTGIAIGWQGDPATLEDEGMLKTELGPRLRRPLAESVFAGRWGEPHPAVAVPPGNREGGDP
jgi:nitroreductase